MPALVTDPDAIDAAWLTEVLRASGALATGRVTAVSAKLIGTGKMGDNVRYTLAYEGAPPDAPASVVAKLPSADPTARVAAAAQGLYWREVCFYREVAPRVGIRTPRAHLALVDDDHAGFVILMEDLHPAVPGDQISGCTPDVAALALRELTKLQAPLMNDRAVLEREWITQPTAEGAALGQAVLTQMWPGFAERFRRVLTPEGAALGERFAARFPAWALGVGPLRTLVHADYRLENMLFGGPDGGPAIAVVDWQSCGNGSPLTDVAYFLGNGLCVGDRREHERELVELYRGELRRLGTEIPEAECWRQYRRAALHGIVITVLGAMMSSPDERGERMFSAMIERHLQHALDLDSVALID